MEIPIAKNDHDHNILIRVNAANIPFQIVCLLLFFNNLYLYLIVSRVKKKPYKNVIKGQKCVSSVVWEICHHSVTVLNHYTTFVEVNLKNRLMLKKNLNCWYLYKNNSIIKKTHMYILKVFFSNYTYTL